MTLVSLINQQKKPSFGGEDQYLTVGDLKQFVYCPRIPYFLKVLGIRPTPTFLMQSGLKEEEWFVQKQKRHLLSRFEISKGYRHPGLVIRSSGLRLVGVIDLVIEGDQEIVVIDFKAGTDQMWENHRAQLVAYALLAEESFNKSCRRGYLFYFKGKQWVKVEITKDLREQTLLAIKQLQALVREERFPAGTERIARCRGCEFINFCGDRW